MLDLDYRVREADGVTLVDAVVESAAPTPRRVRIETTLEGPVWPPRRDGVPERGWDDDRFEGVVPADGRLALGFASPAPPTEPPLFVVDHERADEPPAATPAAGRSAAGSTSSPDWRTDLPGTSVPERSPTGVLRALGSPTPPRDVVPDAAAAGSTPADESAPGREVPPEGPADDRSTSGPAGPRRPPDAAWGRASNRPAPPDAEPCRRRPPVPADVADWLSSVEGRVRRAEALADARRVTTAAGALERVGGLDGARRLVGTIERDERALRAVARRAQRLADRAAEVDVSLSTLRRLT